MSNYLIDSFFDYQVKWMYAGIEATMAKKESLYTCALALSTYTEIMGGLVTGGLQDFTKPSKNYEAFLPYLGQKYIELDNLIKTQYSDRLRSLYGSVRSKLVHEFSLRESHGIWMYEKAHDDQIGLELIRNKTEIAEAIQINFRIPEYYRDFKNGVTKYYNDLKISSDQPPFSPNQTLFVNFMKARLGSVTL